MTRTRIFIVHENQSVASQAMAYLAREKELHVMDSFKSTTEALAYIGNGNCDFILASANLAQDGALKLLKTMRSKGAAPKVIITGLSDSPQQIIRYVAAGAAGYISEKTGVHRWAEHIRAVSAGKALVSPLVAAAMMEHVNRLSRLTARFEPKSLLFANLTEREVEILKLLATGYSNQNIADSLVIGVGTVKNHVHNVLKKLKLRNRKETSTYLSFIQGQPAAPQIPLL
ncbi:MAG: response regulator transcription factor [Caldilineaceae bacterium]